MMQAGAMFRLTRRALLVVGLLPALAWAEADPNSGAGPAGGPTVFTVRVIEASKAATPSLAPELAPVEGELKRLPDFNSFRLIKQEALRLVLNQRGVLTLPDGKSFAITLLDGPAGRVRHKVEMPGSTRTQSVAYGGKTIDALPGVAGKGVIVWSTVEPKR